ncbi:hypothetical protein PAEN110709_21145 [Paenibacillus endophyticus]
MNRYKVKYTNPQKTYLFFMQWLHHNPTGIGGVECYGL